VDFFLVMNFDQDILHRMDFTALQAIHPWRQEHADADDKRQVFLRTVKAFLIGNMMM
jgi:hypothetical protein